MEFLQARRGCKNPSPRRGRTTSPPNQNGWGEENEDGVGEETGVERGAQEAAVWGLGGGQRHVSSTHRGSVGID